ncbi:MAG: hypothetical protein RLZZ546_3393 [Bacteroidota bacterium]|jgi:hypothetical protein
MLNNNLKIKDRKVAFTFMQMVIFFLSLFYFNGLVAQDQALQSITKYENVSLRIQSLKIKQANVEAAAKATIVHFVMKNEDGSYGYSIFVDGSLTYHQPNIPAISGNKGFVKVDHAEAVAKLAIQKIKEGESPPTLSMEEINTIIYN